MKTAIGIICIIAPIVLALWPDIRAAVKKRNTNPIKNITQ